MARKYLHIVGLSFIVLTATAREGEESTATARLASSSAEQRLVTSKGQAGSISAASTKDVQLAVFAGLFILFMLMVAVLFQRYKNRNRAPRPLRKSSLVQNILKADGLSFTPSVFQSDSSPAILVAQQNDDLRLFITNTLRLNYRVISVANGEDAYEKAFELVPDLIITDRFLPGMDGPVFCKRIKFSETTSHIPVIIITPKAHNQISFMDWQDYADDHLSNAFDARELLLRVHALISQRKNLQAEYRRHIKLRDEEIRFPLPEQPFLVKLKRVLRTYYGDPMFGVEHLTDQMQMSRLQLYRKLKALTTYSPNDFIRYYRVEQAKAMLVNEGLSVNDVARRSGFTTTASFNKAFKEITGKSPRDYSGAVAKANSMVEE